MPAAAAGLSVLLVGLALRLLLERLGRDEVVGTSPTDVAFADPGSTTAGAMRRVGVHELAAMASIEFAPPAELTAWQGGVVAAEEVLDEHKVAWLLEAAIAGHVRLDQPDDGPAKHLTLTRLPTPPPPPLTVAEAQVAAERAAQVDGLLDLAFAGRPSVTLGAYDKSFAAMWRQLDTQANAWSDSSGLWERQRRGLSSAVSKLGWLVALVGLAGAAGATYAVVAVSSAFLALVVGAGVLAGLGVAMACAGFELQVRTPAGSGLWVRVESFRRFLHDSEGPQAEEAAKRGVLRQYTAWAIALDEVHHWSKAVEAAGSSIAEVDRTGLDYVYLTPLLINSSHTASVAPTTTGGVGGGVGGGFGGGGGGSW